MADKILLDQIMDVERYNFVSLYESTNPDNEDVIDSSFYDISSDCYYYDPDQFSDIIKDVYNAYSYLNFRGLSSNWESFRELRCELQSNNFS